jgi:surface protein
MSKWNTIIKEKQNRYKQDGIKEVFKKEDGAIDLASIMVGVIVIGLIGGVIAATVFAVIPWSQDNAAKQQLDSIVQAENAYFGLSAANPSPLPTGTPTNSFGKSAELKTANLLTDGPRYCVTTPDDKKSYVGYSQSGSGAIFTVTDKNSKPDVFVAPSGMTAKDALPSDCQFITDGFNSTPAPVVPYVDPTPNKIIMTYQCDATTTVQTPIGGSISNATGTYTWNDGVTSTTTNSNATKSLTAGTKYTFVFEGKALWVRSNTAEMIAGAKCIRSVDHWGTTTGTTSAEGAFQGAINLTDVPANIPSTINYTPSMFSGATNFNDPDVKNWNVSKVTSMSAMFNGATNFNQDLSSWNTGLVTDMSYMFNNASSMNGKLNSWDTSKVTNMDHMFYGASSFNQPLNSWNTSNVTNMFLMFYTAPYSQDLTAWDMNKVNKMAFMMTDPDSKLVPRTTHPNMFRLTYQCDAATTVQTPVGGSISSATGTYTWSDGTTYGSNTSTKTLAAGTKYTFIFEGTTNWVRSDNGTNIIAGAKCIRSLDHWGSATGTGTVSAEGLFKGAINLTDVPANIPTTINNMASMFSGATNFNDPDVKNWNVNKVVFMHYMFNGATNFNQDLSGWNTGLVTDMSYMFNGATAMNSGLNGWNTSNVTNMDHMFYGASSFNQPLNSWNTSNVTNMFLMFFNAPYTQDLTSWDMNKVSKMAFMLNDPDSKLIPRTTHPNMFRLTYQCDTATTVQTPVGGSISSATGTYTWNDGTTYSSNSTTKTLAAGTKYTFIFEGTTNWVRSDNGTNIIAGAKCIRSLDHWGSATGSGSINAQGLFQGAINLTDVPTNIPTTISSMAYMFNGAINFNDPDIKNWDVSKVQLMQYMFNSATSFNQDIHAWNTAAVTNGTFFAPASFPDAYMPVNTTK